MIFLLPSKASDPDRRIFDDLHQDAIALVRNLHVLEQAGGIEALERRIERRGIEVSVGRGVKIGADHIGADMPIAVNRDQGIGILESLPSAAAADPQAAMARNPARMTAIPRQRMTRSSPTKRPKSS